MAVSFILVKEKRVFRNKHIAYSDAQGAIFVAVNEKVKLWLMNEDKMRALIFVLSFSACLVGCMSSGKDLAVISTSSELSYQEFQARKSRIAAECRQAGTPKSEIQACIAHNIKAGDSLISAARQSRQNSLIAIDKMSKDLQKPILPAPASVAPATTNCWNTAMGITCQSF